MNSTSTTTRVSSGNNAENASRANPTVNSNADEKKSFLAEPKTPSRIWQTSPRTPANIYSPLGRCKINDFDEWLHARGVLKTPPRVTVSRAEMLDVTPRTSAKRSRSMKDDPGIPSRQKRARKADELADEDASSSSDWNSPTLAEANVPRGTWDTLESIQRRLAGESYDPQDENVCDTAQTTRDLSELDPLGWWNESFPHKLEEAEKDNNIASGRSVVSSSSEEVTTNEENEVAKKMTRRLLKTYVPPTGKGKRTNSKRGRVTTDQDAQILAIALATPLPPTPPATSHALPLIEEPNRTFSEDSSTLEKKKPDAPHTTINKGERTKSTPKRQPSSRIPKEEPIQSVSKRRRMREGVTALPEASAETSVAGAANSAESKEVFRYSAEREAEIWGLVSGLEPSWITALKRFDSREKAHVIEGGDNVATYIKENPKQCKDLPSLKNEAKREQLYICSATAMWSWDGAGAVNYGVPCSRLYGGMDDYRKHVYNVHLDRCGRNRAERLARKTQDSSTMERRKQTIPKRRKNKRVARSEGSDADGGNEA